MTATITPDARVTIEGNARALYGRTGRAVYAEGHGVWTVELDPTADPIPGDYYPRGGFVSVYEDNLTAAAPEPAAHRATFPDALRTSCTCGKFPGATYAGWKRHANAAERRGETVDARINPAV